MSSDSPRRGSGSGSTGFLSLIKRSSSRKKDKKDKEAGGGSGRTTPTNPFTPPAHVSALPSNPPLLPPSLHPSSPSASPRITNSPPSINNLPSSPSSEPNYPQPSSSSTATSEGRRPSFERASSSLLQSMRRSSYSKSRQGKEPSSVDNDDDQPPPSSRSRSSSPEKPPPPARPPRQHRPPSLDLSSSAFLPPPPTNTTSSPVPSQICLPPESPSEALGATEVIELQAFVDKERWIEDRIEVLKSLPPIECFVVLMPTFKNREEVLPVVRGGGGGLPTKEELDEMFAEQDRIEEEADRFDGGDLERLRKMAKAASLKSLSVSDTDLLSITLSTLFLLDTLLHLLRARGETLDLLALRLQWDAMRFAVARETEGLERDVKAFVEGKGRWGVEKYEKGGSGLSSSGGGMGSPLLGTMARERDGTPGGGHGREGSENESIRSVGGSLKVASRSQRYLLTQILELDSQSFHNRIASLRSGPVVQTGKILDKMIDVAASVRSHQAKRKRMGSSTSTKSLDSTATVMAAVEEEAEKKEEEEEKEDDGAVPEWFLDEMDRVDERVNGLKGYEDLARGSVKQWKFADQTFHTTRKLHSDSTTLAYDLSQAFLQHPSLSRSKAFTAKASAIVSDLTLVPDPSSSTSNAFPRPTHSALPSLPSANRSIASLLSDELSGAKDEARKAHRMAKEYEKLVERVEKLEGLKGEMEKLAGKLEEEGRKLENGLEGTTGGEKVDLSSSDCLKSDKHSAYLAHFPLISTSITSLEPSSTTALRETAALLLALRSAGGVDPNFRSSVEATSNRLEEALRRALAAKESSSVLVERLGRCRLVDEAQTKATNQALELKSRIIARVEDTRWTGLGGTRPSPSSLADRLEATTLLIEQVASLEPSIAKTVSSPLDELSSSLKDHHPQLISHLVDSSSRIRDRLSSLRELARLLQAVDQQSSIMSTVSSEAEQHTQRTFELETSIQAAVLAAKEGRVDNPDSTTTTATLRDHLSTHQSTIQTFISSLSSLVPFVASPNSSAALLAHHLPSLNPSTNTLLTPPRSPAQPFFQADVQATEPSSSVDLVALDGQVRSDANLLAASLSGGVEHLEEMYASIEVARAGKRFKKAEEACVQAMRQWEEKKGEVEEGLDATLKLTSATSDLAGQEALLVELEQLRTQVAETLPPRQTSSSNLLASLEAALSTLRDIPSSTTFEDLPERSTSLLRTQQTHSRLEGETKELLEKFTNSTEDQRQRVEEEKRRLAVVAEEEERRRREEEQGEVARKLAEEEEERRVVEEAAAALRREEVAKRVEEEEARLGREREEKARLEAEAEGRRLAEEEESRRIAEEEKSRKKDLEDEADRVRRVEEEQRLAALSKPTPVTEDASTARSRTTSAVPFPSSSNLAGDGDDVFGPTIGSSTSTPRLPPSTSRNLLDRIHSLQTRIHVLDLRTAASIPSVSAVTPGIHHLPTTKESRNAKQEVESVELETSSLPSPVGGDEKDALSALEASLVESCSLLTRMELLSAFATSVLACDESFSHLLDRIDDAAPRSRPVTPTSPNKSHSSLQDSLDAVTSLFDRAIAASKAISPEDHRVAEEVRRITQAFEEMKEMAEEKMNPLSRLRERSVSVASSFDGSVDGSVDGDEGRRSRGSMSRSSSSASIASLTKTTHTSRIPKSVSTSHSLSSASSSFRTRLPTSSSRPRIPSMMFKPPSSVNTNGSPRSFSGPASSTPTASASTSTPTTTNNSASNSRQAHYHTQTISSSSRERTLSTISSSSGSTQIPSTPVRTRLPSLLNGQRVSSPSPFQNPPTPVNGSSVRSHSTLSRYKRPSTATGVPHSFAEESPDNRRNSTNFGATPRRSISIRSRMDEEDGQMTPTKRTSLGGGAGTNVSPAPRKRYRAKKNDKLDRAVGRIVNALPVDIPIVPVIAGLDSESGKYWIGQPPKLCFCRILRSKTVMVRVGGGWVELSKFLRDHFGILLPDTTSPIPLASQGSDRWIRGGTPLHPSTAASSSFVAPSTPGPSLAPHPPATPNLTFPRNSQSPQLLYSTPGHAFPYRTRHSSLSPATPSFTSPILAQGAEAGSPGSPLVPLHIMRKAEEGAHSPPTISGTGGRKSMALGLGISGGDQRRPTGGEGSMGRSFSGGSVGSSKSSVPWRV